MERERDAILSATEAAGEAGGPPAVPGERPAGAVIVIITNSYHSNTNTNMNTSKNDKKKKNRNLNCLQLSLASSLQERPCAAPDEPRAQSLVVHIHII